MKFLLTAIILSLVLAEDPDPSKDESKHPFGPSQIIGSFLVLIASGLANAGGIGGGPIMVIILMTLFHLKAHESVPISQLIIFGGSLIAIFIKVFLRHPIKIRPLIDFDISLLLCSPILLGTSLGVMINLVIPQWLILLLLTILLFYISTDTWRTGLKIFRKENTTKTSVRMYDPDSSLFGSFTGLDPELESIYNTEAKTAPPKTLIVLSVLFLFVGFSSFVRGSSSVKSIFSIEMCSVIYWLYTVFSFLVLVVTAGVSAIMMKKKHLKKEVLGYDFDTMDLVWSKKIIATVIFAGFLAGLAAGMVGVGGGIVMNPVMLRLGMRPEVSTATSSFMVLFTSTISMLQYAIAGKLDPFYGFITLAFSLVGSTLGILVLKKIIEKYKRASIIVMLLALILSACAIVIPTWGIYNYTRSNQSDGFRDYCRG
jgi:uncharacterized membrane protein YfcA